MREIFRRSGSGIDYKVFEFYYRLTLEHFDFRNQFAPEADVYIHSSQATEIMKLLDKYIGKISKDAFLLNFLSSQVGIDVDRLSSADIMHLRRDEELFAIWRQIVRDSLSEIERDYQPDQLNRELVQKILKDRSLLWKDKIAARTRSSSALANIFDRTSITLGFMSGVIAQLTTADPALSLASAAAGGAAAPFFNLMFNLADNAAKRNVGKACRNHFMCVGGA